ncbi:Aste57867_8451 [Aphanomyces stellatus]|uniref:Aste57867_8451 protein n=1 Tax=Aphanomyces stellatus TaxID=120398 RepID=A0A485KKG6_9STRA|nr:hypothetical protein As57867_008419 [Aphanomyces stellatus]VFT85337.1 Aste57867_8451 [Aphanomyces stellatus]
MKLTLAVATVVAVSTTPTTAWTCSPPKITDWIAACDKFGTPNEKCKDMACHKALHYLVEDDVRQCYADSNMGPVTDLDKYRELDDYCHGDTPAPKPEPSPSPTPSAPSTPTSPTTFALPTTPQVPTTTTFSTPSTPSPRTTSPSPGMPTTTTPSTGSTSRPLTTTAAASTTFGPVKPPSNGCVQVSVVGDATYCIQAPICSGSGILPAGINCPKAGDLAVQDCLKTLKSYVDDVSKCVAPVDAVCKKIPSGAWGCVWNLDGGMASVVPTPAVSKPSTM